MFTDAGRQFVAWRLGSSLPDLYINYIGIGIGSTTATEADTTLVSESNRVAITGSPDFTDARKVTFQADLNSVQMSGINLAEFGLFHMASGQGGSVWQREAFDPIEFDGTNEVQIISTLQVLRSGVN